jgi:ribonucleoside-triphosphate reductase
VNSKNNIIVYSTVNCPKCEDIKKRFNSLGINYTINQNKQEMIEMGIKYVPMINLNGTLYNYETTINNLHLFQEVNARKLMSEAKFYEAYARYDDNKQRYETWEESVHRVMNMHRNYYKSKMTEELSKLLEEVEDTYRNKLILGAQRALQFGGKQLLAHMSRLYNCSASYCDRPDFFGGFFYLLLSGCGVGFSVQNHHIAQLPNINKRIKSAKTYIVPDSIEGWANTIDVLLSSYFVGGGVYPEYEGRKVYFDLSNIRPKGSFISGGFKAPGSEPLRKALDTIEQIIEKELRSGSNKLRPIIAYDICMHIADAVISGGVRRSATICLFSKNDTEMINAKTGNWWIDNPQRGRSNNSVVLLRKETTFEEFQNIMQSVKEFGEPAFVWTDDLEFIYNPCVEVGMYPKTVDGRSGFQLCNLSEINGAKSTSKEIFFNQCKIASILGTIQAGYTDFKFLKDATKEIVEKEALIGVGITGMMNNPHILFDEEIIKEGARIVKFWNKKVCEMIGVNQAARTTVIKPSGNSAVLLECASGIHGEHSETYLRHVQLNKDSEVAQLFINNNPEMCEDSLQNRERDIVVAFPITPNPKSIFKKDLLGVKQLEYVKKTQMTWIEEGTNIELCAKPNLRHNVSNTITVDNWDEVTQYIFDNRNYLCGVSLLSAAGDKAYPQAPFTEVLKHSQIVEKYGEVALFTSALIEAGLNAFNEDLWLACSTALGYGEKLTKDNHTDLLKRDFVRRFNKFSSNFISPEECANCLKDVYNLHKLWKINKNIKNINWTKELNKKSYTDIDTMGAIACSGGKCEI